MVARSGILKVLADPGPGIVVFGPMNPPTRTLTESHWWGGAFRGPGLS